MDKLTCVKCGKPLTNEEWDQAFGRVLMVAKAIRNDPEYPANSNWHRELEFCGNCTL